MPFSEKIKKEVKEKAAFRCCCCQDIGSIEAHHIIPQEFQGEDTFENAAPLCPSCHAKFGDNPKKRKEITQMRDWWYKKVQQMYPDNSENLKMFDVINSKLEKIQYDTNDITELKNALTTLSNKMINNITPETAKGTATALSNASLSNAYSKIASSTKLGDKVHANVICKKCNTAVGLLVGTNNCPTCGEPIS